MKRAWLALGMMVVAAAASGCKKARTEMYISVQTEGVRVPEDVAQVRMLVLDRQGGGDSIVYDNTVALCTPTLTTGCYTLPLSAVLHPGAKQPNDTVKVQIDALSRTGAKVTSSAAIFTFSPKQSLRIDFVLYAACIGVTSCSERDQACGPDAMCTTLTPTPLESEPDLGPGGRSDMSGPHDMAAPPGSDLSSTDMAAPPGSDMSSTDMAIGLPQFDFSMGCAINCDMAIGTGMKDFGPIMTGNDGFIM
jgi:hypothetical protein